VPEASPAGRQEWLVATIERNQARGTRRVGGVLRQRNFRLLWIGESVSETGNAMAVVGVPLLVVVVLHASTFAAAALTAAAYLPWMVIGLPAGAWVDRLPCRPLMVACDVISALLFASLPVAAWLHILTTVQVVAVVLLAGAASVLFTTAYQVYLPVLVSADDLIEGNAKLQGSTQVAMIAGRGAAGLAAQAVGDATALLFNSASFVVSAACLLSIPPTVRPRPPASRVTSVRSEIAAGVKFIVRDPYLRLMTIYAAVANLTYSGSTALMVVFLVRVAGFGGAETGLLMGSGSIGGVLGALTARHLARWLGTSRALLAGTVGTGLFGLLIPLTAAGPRTACYVIGSGLVSAGIVISNIIVGSFRQAYCPLPMLGRISASMRFLAYGAISLGALLAGELANVLTVRAAMWIIMVTYALAGTVLLSHLNWSDRDMPARAAADAS
jgi:Transmembrane secretion effector